MRRSRHHACLFRYETGRGPRGRNTVDIEVLIYSEDLHLLEVIGDNPERRLRHKHWPHDRTILADDIRALLVQVRDFWTDLIVDDLSAKDKLFNYQSERCLDQMWEFGGSAWRLFFGNDRDAGASVLGDLIGSVDLPKDSVI